MGQQPNIELEIADLPRPRRKPDPARSWVPGRPGELGGPDDARFGAGFGNTGPDSGYAITLVKARGFNAAPGEQRGNTEVALAAVAAARAALYGRAPSGQDVDMALVLLGLDPAVPEAVAAELAESRVRWFAGAAHHPAKLHGFTASLESATLRLTAEEARIRMAQGTSLIKH